MYPADEVLVVYKDRDKTVQSLEEVNDVGTLCNDGNDEEIQSYIVDETEYDPEKVVLVFSANGTDKEPLYYLKGSELISVGILIDPETEEDLVLIGAETH